ncbi:CoA transferase [Sphingopyxis sp. MC1]|uniref:CoA transferase n=1 Tax=Sphingopyxis sp. MC1 TaxID=1174684 RepID=UPI0002D1AFC3|nr:CoA transferase [Sphingopyxis sp. MC1]ENY80189.1 L-carnitine dehydratase/bile acid-inducible protein F [Sphingopyxis sp. MC1]
MYDLLKGIRIVEGASFVAAPLGALHMQQMGAEVIRFDPIGGGPDFTRWPRADNGASFYWEGLNKGKKSVAIDLRSEEGRELAQALAASVGRLISNYPARGFLSHDELTKRRTDMLTVRVMGWADGGNALDYTVNAALGVPLMTGPIDLGPDEPVNHMLPAWDLAAGLYAAFALLAAERAREADGQGREIRVALGDIAISSLAALGLLAEGEVLGTDRPRFGNDLYGAFGRNFRTADDRQLMITAISPRQWSGLLKALGIESQVSAIEAETGVSFASDEGLRFVHRDRLNPIVADAIAVRTYADLARAFDESGVTWAPYRKLSEAVREDARVADNPMLSAVSHLTGATYLTAGAAGTIPGEVRGSPLRAPRLGEHSEEVLAEVMGIGSGTIADLIDRRVIGVSR